MSFSRFKYLAAPAVLATFGGALVGLPVAQAKAPPRAVFAEAGPKPSKTLINCVDTNEINETLCLITKVGPKGPRGATGATGPIGPVGPVGPVGATGVTGSTGATGPPAAQGMAGSPRSTGQTGPTR